MSFSLGPKGGIQDPEILRLLAKLTTLVKAHSANSPEVVAFIEQKKDITFVDELSQHMHTFKELAEALAPLIEGIKFENNPIPGDGWQLGSVEGLFEEKDPDEPADWWKNDSKK